MKPPSQVTVTGTAESAVHDAEADALEVDDVAVIEMDDELVESVELGELLEVVGLDEELESVAEAETDEELESELEAAALEDELEAAALEDELESAALEDELEATELELEDGQGGETMNATCHEESGTS